MLEGGALNSLLMELKHSLAKEKPIRLAQCKEEGAQNRENLMQSPDKW